MGIEHSDFSDFEINLNGWAAPRRQLGCQGSWGIWWDYGGDDPELWVARKAFDFSLTIEAPLLELYAKSTAEHMTSKVRYRIVDSENGTILKDWTDIGATSIYDCIKFTNIVLTEAIGKKVYLDLQTCDLYVGNWFYGKGVLDDILVTWIDGAGGHSLPSILMLMLLNDDQRRRRSEAICDVQRRHQ